MTFFGFNFSAYLPLFIRFALLWIGCKSFLWLCRTYRHLFLSGRADGKGRGGWKK